MPILNWIGKDKVSNHDKELPFKVLKPIKELSVGKESKNLLIEGDNLEALKALMPFYYKKVKFIYIDPPYNTGNEKWVYNDKVNSPHMKKWLNSVVGIDDLERHDKWICMMYPRLKLLNDLLRDDGLIFVSIDDNEVSHLRRIMDDIFVGGFVAQLPTIMNLKGNNDEFGFAGTHEYTLVYAKDKNKASINQFEINEEEFNSWEEDEIGAYKKGAPLRATGTESLRENRPLMFYPILVNETKKIVSTINEDEFSEIYDKKTKIFNDKHLTQLKTKYKNKGYAFVLPMVDSDTYGRWRWGYNLQTKRKLLTEILYYKQGNAYSLYKKQRPELGDIPSKKPKSIFYKPEYSSGNGTAQLKKIFGSKVFNNPKPIDLIKDFIFISTNKNSEDIILDSFAGSGTTGHSVLELNKEDGGNRIFILVELENKIAKQITSVRLRKAIQGYAGSNFPGGTGQDFQYLELNGELYTSNGSINPEAKYEDLAGYIYFTETRNYLDLTSIKNPLIGSFGSNYYFLFFREKDKNVLDDKTAKKIDSYNGTKIVYADKCLLDDEYLEKHKIIFKQIPYELKKY